MSTTLKNALRRWEEENKDGQGLMGRATEVILSFCRPPIYKLDNALSLLTSVEMLSLSSNCIEKIAGFANLKNLRILSLARNNIKDLSGLEVLHESLEQLWISYNSIDKLRVLTSLSKLKVLYIAHNLIRDWNEVQRLQELPQLADVLFLGNPIYESMESEDKYRSELARRLPKLKNIDGQPLLGD